MKVNNIENLFKKNLQLKRCLFILDLKPLRSQDKGKHSIGKELQILAVWRKKLLTMGSLKYLGMVT